MKTEAEARDCWCPFAMTANRGNRVVYFGRKSDADESCRCIASECMAWRSPAWYGHDGDFVNAEKRGYCGLAGKP